MDLETIQQQLTDAGVTDTFGTKKEIKALPDMLSDDEVIQYATSGFVDGNTVLMVCTNTRVLFVDKGLVFGIKSTEIPLTMINGVSYSKGLMFGKISIVNGAITTKIDQVNKDTAPKMVEAVKKATAALTQVNQQPVAQTATKSEPDLIEQLRGLKVLVDEGVLTQDEFDAKKKQVLGI